MTKNASGLRVLVSALALVAGCSSVRAKAPEPLQGVVELDERVLGFEVGGRARRLHVSDGDRLEVGSPIAELDDTLERIGREARASELVAVRSQLELLRAGARSEDVRALGARIAAARASETLFASHLRRQRVLEQRGATARVTTDELEAQLARARAERAALGQQQRAMRHGARAEELAAAEARVQSVEAGLRALDERLRRYALRADRACTVLRTHVDAGEIVAPGAPVVTVADVEHPYVDVFVPQAEVSGLRVGTPVQVRIDARREPLPGRIEHVGHRTEFTPRYLFSERERPNLVLRVRVRVDDPRRSLLAGVPAFVTLGDGGGSSGP